MKPVLWHFLLLLGVFSNGVSLANALSSDSAWRAAAAGAGAVVCAGAALLHLRQRI